MCLVDHIRTVFDSTCNSQLPRLMSKGVLIATQLNSTQLNWTKLNSTRQREQQLTQFVGHDVINKNTTDLAVRCSTGSVEFSSVEFSWVELCRYKHPFKQLHKKSIKCKDQWLHWSFVQVASRTYSKTTLTSSATWSWTWKLNSNLPVKLSVYWWRPELIVLLLC